MYLSRTIDSKLMSWVNDPDRRPLILRGARQVGKTASIRELGKKFTSFAIINFERHEEGRMIFEGNLDPIRIIRDIETLLHKEIVPGETLLFFDEIQDCPKAITSLRYFFEEMPELHVIAAGSLLEFVIGKMSVPVGRIQYEYMYPLSLSEFLCATGRKSLAKQLPIISYQNNSIQYPKITPFVMKSLNTALREYFVVGGMPECVAKYSESRSFERVAKIQDRLISVLRDDLPKYASGELQIRNLSLLISRLFMNIGRQTKYTTLSDGDNITRTKNSVYLLEKAMVCHVVKTVNPGGLPLGASTNDKFFKLIFLDIGLGQRLSGLSSRLITTTENTLKIYDGKLAEQFVGQQLLSESSEASEGRDLYCWIRTEKSSSAEVDYLLARNARIVPVEVKSGKSGSLKSLHLLRKKYQNIGPSLCLQHVDQVTLSNDVNFLPLFSVL